MAADIPTIEPVFITAGDTVRWTRSFSDYSNSQYTLSYAFQKEGGDGQITFDASASGNNFLVNLAPGVTAGYTAGRYLGQGYVSKSGERYKVWEGPLEVGENFAAEQLQVDPRTRAKRILDFIESTFEKVVQKQPVAATVDGVQFQFRSLKEWTEARNYWAIVVKQEEDKIAGRKRGVILGVFHGPIS